MKKFVLMSIFSALVTSSLHSQSDVSYVRKGKFILETNYSFLSTIIGGSSGFGFAIGDLSSLMNIGLDFGKFIGNNFAMKGSFSVLSSGENSLLTYSLGFKGYIGGSFVVNPSGGIITDGDSVEMLLCLH